MPKPLIKWPGGKASELEQFMHLIPQFDRYIEPFFGGGALFFELAPKRALINDVSESLMDFYILLRDRDEALYQYLLSYDNSFQNIQTVAMQHYEDLYQLFFEQINLETDKDKLGEAVHGLIYLMADDIAAGFTKRLVPDLDLFFDTLVYYMTDKILRLAANYKKAPMSQEDVEDNLITGLTSGYYMYFRNVYNDLQLNRGARESMSYRCANFYFIREYCYGSMFRYNSKGEFNIPYGGISYNKKNFRQKVDYLFSQEISDVFEKTSVYCQDFESFLERIAPGENDFMFLDPPYDTEFSDYEGKAFTKKDHERLAAVLVQTKAKFLLVIKNTEFIYNLYREGFHILRFQNHYLYNVKSRNDREAEHLIITNMNVSGIVIPNS